MSVIEEGAFAELRLCFCLCRCYGASEGIYGNWDLSKDYLFKKYFYAMGVVQQVLKGEKPYPNLHLTQKIICRTFDEVNALIDFAKVNFSNVGDGICLDNCMHGDIGFFRTIVFDGASIEDCDSLIDRLMLCDQVPPVYEWEQDETIKTSMAKEEFEERLRTRDWRKPWRENLHFYHGRKMIV